MITIDGSFGEGGGQVLRTSLALAAITGQPVHLDKIRAARPKPGLQAQHLTSVRAAAAICGAEVEGDVLGSSSLVFRPRHPPQAAEYVFDVTEARESGSAGATTLILQTVLLPLTMAQGESRVVIRGEIYDRTARRFPTFCTFTCPPFGGWGFARRSSCGDMAGIRQAAARWQPRFDRRSRLRRSR